MEYYSGEKYCQLLYDRKPKYGIKEGTLETEKILIQTNLLNQLRDKYHFGIYSGRNYGEYELVKSKIGFDKISKDFVFLDDGSSLRKPDPVPLYKIVEKCDSKGIVFLGDSFDDYQTIKDFQNKYKNMFCEFVQVLDNKGPFDQEVSFIKNVNQLLEFLIQENKNETNQNLTKNQ